MGTAPSVLIATHYFAPKNEIAAVRLTNFAMGLVEQGWDVDVVTVGANPANPLERRLDLGIEGEALGRVRVHQADAPWVARALYGARELARSRRSSGHPSPAAPGEPAGAPRSGSWGSLAARARSGIAAASARSSTRLVEVAYVKAMATSPHLRQHYDAIWASYGPTYVIEAGARLAARFPDAAYVVDVRDLIVRRGPQVAPRERRRQERLEARLLHPADAATVVSEGLLLHEDRLAGPLHVLTNGFDLGVAPAPPAAAADDAIVLYYGGRIYPERRFDALVLACRELARRRAVEVHYAGPDEQVFRAAFRAHDAESLVRTHGIVSREESMRLSVAATCTLVFSWNGAERGMLTGKVFELISLDRPVVTIVAGDAATSALADLFAGDPYRRVFGNETAPADVMAVAAFVEEMAAVGSIPAPFHARQRYDGYTYPRLVERLDTILRDAIDRHAVDRLAVDRHAVDRRAG